MTNQKMYKFTYFSFFFVALGVFTSVTIPAGFHIFGGIPLLLLTIKFFKEGHRLPKSAYALIAISLWGYFVSAMNFDSLNNPMRSFGKEKYNLFAVMLVPALFYMQDFLNSHRWKKLTYVFFFTIVAAATYGIVKSQLRFDLFTFENVPVDFNKRNKGFTEIMRYGYGTGFVISMMLACIPFGIKHIKIFDQKAFYLTLAAALIGLYYAGTRGAILGVFVSIPVILYFISRKLAVVTIAVGLILGSYGVYKLKSQNLSSNRIFSKLGSDSNLKRLSQYQASWKAFTEKPFIGHGVNQFSSICPDIKKRYGISYKKYCHDYPFLKCNYDKRKDYCGHSHNIFLENLANRGVLGAVLFALFLVLWSIEMFSRKDVLGLVFLAFIANFLAASQFEYTLNANNSFMIFFLYGISFVRIPERFKLADRG